MKFEQSGFEARGRQHEHVEDGVQADLERAPLIASDGAASLQQGRQRRQADLLGGDGGNDAAVSAPRRALRAALQVVWDNGALCALGAAIFFTLAATCVKTIEDAVPVLEIVVVRALVSGAITASSCRLNGIPIFGHTAPLWLKIARGVIGAVAMTTSYEAIVRLPLADSTVIFFLSPSLTSLLAWLLLGEAFGWLTALGCAASFTGVVLVAQPPWLLGEEVPWSGQRKLGMVFGFIGAALAAGAYICIRTIGRQEHPLTVAMFFHLSALVTGIIPLAAGYPQSAVLPTLGQFAVLLLIACGSFGGNLFVNRAFQISTAAKASSVNMTQVIFAYLIGSLFFHDPITLVGLAGAALILGGVASVNLDKLAKDRSSRLPQPGHDPEQAGQADGSSRSQQAAGKQHQGQDGQQRQGWQKWLRWQLSEQAPEGASGLDQWGQLKAKNSERSESQLSLSPLISSSSSGWHQQQLALLQPLHAERAA